MLGIVEENGEIFFKSIEFIVKGSVVGYYWVFVVFCFCEFNVLIIYVLLCSLNGVLNFNIYDMRNQFFSYQYNIVNMLFRFRLCFLVWWFISISKKIKVKIV